MASVYKSLSKANGDKAEGSGAPVRKNRQRVLILSSRGVTYRHRHLLNDLASLLPHSRKDTKFDSKSKLWLLNENALLQNCNNIMFFEARKGKDLYMHLSSSPNGPTCKFHVQNLHTMDELNFVGNCLKGSRPILSFDAAFDKEPHLRVVKNLFTRIFGVPEGTRRSKPFIDHVMGFTVADNKIWVRNYQVSEAEPTEKDNGSEGELKSSHRAKSKETEINLVEIGPRFTLSIVVIQESSFGGPIIYSNKMFVSPNQVRADLRRAKAGRHNVRAEKQFERLSKKGELGLRTDVRQKRKSSGLDTGELFS